MGDRISAQVLSTGLLSVFGCILAIWKKKKKKKKKKNWYFEFSQVRSSVSLSNLPCLEGKVESSGIHM